MAPLSFVRRLILFVLHLSEPMFFIFSELPHICVSILVVVYAIDRISLVEPAHEELPIGKQVGALAMEEIVAPLTNINVSVGVSIDSVAMSIFVF